MQRLPALTDNRVYSKSYAAFRGVDFTTDQAEIDDSRSPDSLNMICDDAGFPEKRVGWRVMTQFAGRINGLHYADLDGYGPVILVHHGTKLHAINPSSMLTLPTIYDAEQAKGANIVPHVEPPDSDEPIDLPEIDDVVMIGGISLQDAPSSSFAHGGYLFLLDGEQFLRVEYDEDTSTFKCRTVKSVATIPTTGRGGHYELVENSDPTEYTWESCTPYQEPNLLTATMYNTLAGDGVNTDFWLMYKGCTVTNIEKYVDAGEWEILSIAYTVTEDSDKNRTKITFDSAPEAHPDGAGIDNIRVTFTTTDHEPAPEQIEHCTICTRYGYFNDNRFFVSGNPDQRNRDWASAVDDPAYWELNQWTDIGSDQTAVMGYLHYGDVLAIIKEDDNQDAEIYIRSAAVQSDNSVLWPVQQGVKGVGAISKGAFVSLRDDALFYAKEGVFAVVGTDASQQRTVQNRSYYVDRRMSQEVAKQAAVAVVWGNLYLLCFPNSGHCYVADARQQTGFNESYVYEWFYWDNIPACRFLELDGMLFFGTADGRLCKFNSDMMSNMKYADGLTRVPGADGTLESESWAGGKAIKARWTTRAEAFGVMNRLKTITKRGCVCVLKPVSGSKAKIYLLADGAARAYVETEEQSGYIETDTIVGFDFSNIDFGNFAFGGLYNPQIVPLNSKVKKFQMLKLKFENDQERMDFGLQDVQLQYNVNNYIK